MKLAWKRWLPTISAAAPEVTSNEGCDDHLDLVDRDAAPRRADAPPDEDNQVTPWTKRLRGTTGMHTLRRALRCIFLPERLRENHAAAEFWKPFRRN